MADPFVAEIRIFAGNFAPKGWAFCNGQLLPLSQNTALFSLLGTTYGGDGKSTFALPDLQGRAPMHPGQGPGLSNRSLGEEVGTDTVTILEAEMPSHNHTMRADGSTGGPLGGGANASSPVNNYLGATVKYQSSTSPQVQMAPLASAGGSLPHNNLQPFLTLNFIIALQGVFPPRT
jgi:microcystin-dependent protein